MYIHVWLSSHIYYIFTTIPQPLGVYTCHLGILIAVLTYNISPTPWCQDRVKIVSTHIILES